MGCCSQKEVKAGGDPGRRRSRQQPGHSADDLSQGDSYRMRRRSSTGRRDSEVALGSGPVACPRCGDMVHPRMKEFCPMLPMYAPALGRPPQLCTQCCTGRAPHGKGQPAAQEVTAAPAKWNADSQSACSLRDVTPEWSECGGQARKCGDCGGTVCRNCLQFVDSAARIVTWLRDCAAAASGPDGPRSPQLYAIGRDALRKRVFVALHDGFHQAVWERIDKAVERRARTGQSNSSLDWTMSSDAEAVDSWPSTLRWPQGGLTKIRQNSLREAESQHQALQRAISQDEQVPEDYLLGLLREAAAILTKRPNVQQVDLTDESAKCVVVGDLHGQLRDLLFILEEHGLPRSGKTVYVFNGDFVDRGNRGCEVVAVILSLLIVHPGAVFLNRGNHECRKLTSAYNFRAEVEIKYGPGRVFDGFSAFFSSIPLCVVICNELLVVHAGIPRDTHTTLADINRLERRVEQIPDHDGLFADLVWSDPVDTMEGWRNNGSRGAGILWGSKHTARFLDHNKLRHVIRSHEVFDSGFHWHHGRRVTTVFSASHYTGSVYRNEGAVIVVSLSPLGAATRTEMSADTWKVYEDQFARGRSGSYGSAGGRHGSDPMSPMSPHPLNTVRSLLGRDPIERKVRRELGEMVSRHRHQLLLRFTACDRHRTGVIDAWDWAQCVRAVTRVDAAWYFLRHSLAGSEAHLGRASGGVRYMQFVRRFGIPMEHELSEGWLRMRARWLTERCGQRERFAVGQRVRCRNKGGKWRIGLVVNGLLGFKPIVGNRIYHEVEHIDEAENNGTSPAKLFDMYDSQLTGMLSFGEFHALITDGLQSPMTKAEIFMLFLELLRWEEAAVDDSETPGCDAFLTKERWMATLEAGGKAPFVRDVVLGLEDPADPDEGFHMWDVWLLLRFRCLFRDLVRFHGDRRTAFAVFTGRASSSAVIDRQGVRRALRRLRLSAVAAPEREAEWPSEKKLRAVPPDMVERFWPGASWVSERGAYVLPVWRPAPNPALGPPDEHIDAFISRLSGGRPTATYNDFLRAFFVHDMHEEVVESDSDEVGPDDISVAAITPTPTGKATPAWRTEKTQGYIAAAASETEMRPLSIVT